MRTPTPGQLLDAWDTAVPLRCVDRCEVLLAAARDDEEPDRSEDTVGERDRRLVELRQRLFGRTIHAVESCTACGLAHDLELSTATLLATPRAREPEVVRAGDVTVTCRPLRPDDVAAAGAAATTLQQARTLLLSRAVVSVHRDGQPLTVGELPEEAVEAVAAALAEADPLAGVNLPLTCEDCGHAWTATLDIADYLWREVDSWATRTLREVAVLARAYGWTERDVLALPPQRRRRYLELATDG